MIWALLIGAVIIGVLIHNASKKNATAKGTSNINNHHDLQQNSEQEEQELQQEAKQSDENNLKSLRKKIIKQINKPYNADLELLQIPDISKMQGEEKFINSSYIEMIKQINQRLENEQYVSYLNSRIKAQKELMEVNRQLGFKEDQDVCEIIEPQDFVDNKSADFTFNNDITPNFNLMVSYFSDKVEWMRFFYNSISMFNGETQKTFSSLIKDEWKNLLKTDQCFTGNFAGITAFFLPCYVLISDDMQTAVALIYYNDISIEADGKDKIVFNLKNYKIQRHCQSDINEYIKSFLDFQNLFQDEYNKLFISLCCNTEIKQTKETIQIEYDKYLNAKIEEHRQELISKLNIPTFSLPKEKKPKSLNDEISIINHAYSEFLRDKHCRKTNDKYLQYLSQREKVQNEIRSLNRQLNNTEEADIGVILNPNDLPYKPTENTDHLSNNFFNFCKKYQNDSLWKSFYQTACKYTDKNGTKIFKIQPNNDFSNFIKDINALYLIDEENIICFTPEYVLVFSKDENEIIAIVPFAKIKFRNEFSDSDKTNVTANDTIIKKTFQYQNADGTPDRRHKINPVTYTVRTWKITISIQKGIAVKFVSSDATFGDNLCETFEIYKNSFKSEPQKTIFNRCFDSASLIDIDAIEADFLQKEKSKQEKEEKKRKLAEIEQKRIEEEKKKAMIQRQIERNEEAKKQTEAKKKSLEIFGVKEDEDVQNSFHYSKQNATTNSQNTVKIIGNTTVTNNVFTISFEEIQESDGDTFSVYYTDIDSNVISEVRTIHKIGLNEKVTVGITLLSGIDFTGMKNCILKIESNSTVLTEIKCQMNISFYSDF